ncbi:MAG: hypothetical protein J5911_04275 [Clostridia bacterium]|nr:hypothetical protein [Clostridia bacterium]
MEKEAKNGNFIMRLLALLKSRRTRNIIYLAIILFSAFAMFLIDKSNFFRDGDVDGKDAIISPLAFLKDNLFSKILDLFGIQRYNVTASSWVLFIILMIVALMILIGHIIAPRYVATKVAENIHFSSDRKAKIFYTCFYYGVLLLIAAAIIAIAVFAGLFSYFGSNTAEASPFVSLLEMIGLFLLFIIVLLLFVIIVYYIVKLILLAIAVIFRKTSKKM